MRKPRYLILSLVFTVIALLSLYGLCWSATYYVDATLGSDASADPTNIATPWQTIAKVNSTLTGDQSDTNVLFKKGETWREQLTVPGSGTSGHPFTFGAYGSGEKPIISGADVLTSWTAAEGTWQVALDLTASFNLEFTDGATRNYRQILAGGTSPYSGSKVRVTFYAEAANAWLIDGVSIGVMTANDDFDSAPTRLTFSSNNSVVVPANSYSTSDGVVFAFNKSVRHGIHFYTTSRHAKDINVGYSNYYNTFASDDTLTQAISYDTTTVWIGIGKIEVLTDVPENLYTKTGITTDANYVFFDGVCGNRKTSVGALAEDKDYYMDSAADTLYIYSSSDPAGRTIEACQRNSCIVSNKAYITIDGLNLQKQNSVWEGVVNIGYTTRSASNNTIQNCTIEKFRGYGIQLYSAASPSILSNTIIGELGATLATSLYNCSKAININQGSTAYAPCSNVLIDGNDISNCFYSIDGAGSSQTSGSLVVGYTYTIATYVSDDDFTNVGAGSNASGISFVATNTTPTHWAHSSVLVGRNSTSGTISNNIIHDMNGEGISLYLCNGIIIEYNDVHDIDGGAYDSTGIHTFGGDSNIIRYNKIYSITATGSSYSYGASIQIDGHSTVGPKLIPPDSCEIYYNLAYDNDQGMVTTNATNVKWYNNTIYNIGNIVFMGANSSAFVIQGSQTSGEWKNNVLFGISPEDDVYLYLIPAAPTSGATTLTNLTITNNQLYKATGNWYSVLGTIGSTFATWNAFDCTGTDIWGDPLFVNAAGGDFRLQSGSPAINAGVDVGLVTDYSGFPVGATPEIGAFESGNAPRFNSGGTGGGVMQ